MLLAAGYRVKKQYLERLRQLGYVTVMIEQEGTEGIVPETTVKAETQREMLSSITHSTKDMTRMFDHYRAAGVKAVEDAIHQNRQHLGKYIMNSGLTGALEKFIEEIMTQSDVVLNLNAMQQADAALFAHTMNVTITALCIGRKYHFSYEELKQLGVGALSYDLGMVAVPREILDKQTDLTDEERANLKQHPLFGFLMLNENSAIPATSAAVALQHHENQDGTGYPRGMKGENRLPQKDFTRQNVIHRFAEIVAVADRYDMMVTGRRHFCSRMNVQEAIKRLILMSGPLLNAEVVKMLVSIVPMYPVGARVRIVEAPSTQLVGYIGAVAKDNPSDLEKPFIILYQAKSGQKITPFSIDLSKHPGFVLEVV
jgi:HD-GYP domain-containing protein (c-di-GMP phosphodiesterase class II)